MSDIPLETTEARKVRPFPVRLREGEDALLSIREAAALLALSVGHIHNHLDEFFPERVQYGERTVRVRLSDVLKLIERRTTRPPASAEIMRLLDDGT